MLHKEIINDGSDHGDQHQETALEKHDETQAARAATGTLRCDRGPLLKRKFPNQKTIPISANKANTFSDYYKRMKAASDAAAEAAKNSNQEIRPTINSKL